jgi:hypothetical protein
LPDAGTVARELAVVVAAGLVYGGVREVTEGSVPTALSNADRLARLEEAVGLDWESAVQSLVVGREPLVDLVNWIYIWGHWPLMAAVAIALFIHRRDRYALLRNAVLVSGAIGFLFFGLIPTAPPRLADVGLVDTVLEQSSSYRVLQPSSLTNQYAALPSLHFGWNLLVGIVLFGAFRSVVVRVFAVAMPAAMAFAVVATANHWVLDVAVGGAVVAVGLIVARRLAARGCPAD